MQEPEVSLRIAMAYIQDGKTHSDITVSIDGAHIKTKDTIHFDIAAFMKENDYVKCDSDYARWQGIYQNSSYAPRIIVSSKPGVGDVVIPSKGREGAVYRKQEVQKWKRWRISGYAGSNRPIDDRLSR